MNFREAIISDIPEIQRVRNSVLENRLSDPGLVSDEDCKSYLFSRGKGWVCETRGKIIAFAVADLWNKNIWALFVEPSHENMGIGSKLQEIMLNWYFSQTQQTVWLSTSPGTRAERFYRKSGWKENGTHGKKIRFEFSISDWRIKQKQYAEK